MRTSLLTVDSVINLILGALLVVFPRRVVAVLGLPWAESAFYPSILGAVLLGIGLALVLEQGGARHATAGLGLLGAVVINLCAAVVLAAWLLWGNLGLPPRGAVLLWVLVAVLVGLGVLELGAQLQRGRGSREA
jgi:hypothetical protein